MKAILITLILIALSVQNSLSQTDIPESKTETVSAMKSTKLFKSNALKMRFEYPEGLETEEWIDQVSLIKRLNPTGARINVSSIVNTTKSDSYSAAMAKLIYNRLKRTKVGETINSNGLNGWIYTREEDTKIADSKAYKAIAVFDSSRFENLDNLNSGRGMGPRYELYFYFKRGKELWSITCGARSKERLERYIPAIEILLKSLKFEK